jgi:phage minor structural protein
LLIVKDIFGNEEGFVGYKGLKRSRTKDGEKTLSFLAIPDVTNEHSYPLIQNESTVEFAGDTYRVKQLKEKSRGKVTFKEVVAIHTFFDLIDEHIYEVHNGSLTFANAVQFVLGPYGYTWDIIGTFYAQDWENFGDENPIALFQDLLKRYKAEFTLNGTHLTFKNKIGNATDFQLRYNYNIKSIEKSSDSSNFSTYIRGFGKDGLEAEYISPLDEANGGPFKRKHAKPVRDERYTTYDGLMERLQTEIPSTIPFSVTVDFLDLRRAGYPYDVPNEGDDMFVIHEPMTVDLEARIMEIGEEFTEGNPYPVKTDVTIANYRDNMTDKFVEYSRTSKTVGEIIEGTRKLPYSALDDAVKRATEALQSAQTELEFENGIIARSKDNPNHLVLFNSAGVGVSLDGGQTFRTAMTAEGFVADLMTVGTMLMERIKGGTLTLGGQENGNGKMVVLDEDGEIIADLDAARGGFDKLYASDFTSPTVERVNRNHYNLYVDPIGGNDNNAGKYWEDAKKTIMSAINSIPKMNYGAITIYIHFENGRNIYENLVIEGFLGSGDIVINFQTKLNKLIGTVLMKGCTNNIQLMNGTVNTDSTTHAAVQGDRCLFVSLYDMEVFGNNKAYAAYVASGGTTAFLWHSRGWNVTDVIRSESMTRVFIDNCDGLASSAGLAAVDGGIVRGYGAAPAGSIYNIYEARGGDVVSDFTFPSAPVPPTPPAPPETSKQIGTNSGNNWSESGYWSNDGVKQGNYSYGNRHGCWFFGTSILDNIGGGRTIKAMRVYITRDGRGGSSAPQRHSLRAHGHTSQPGGAPSLSGEIGAINLGWGQPGWINVDSSAFAAFANGSYRGFGLYTGGDNYSVCSTSCTVEITYQ